MAYANTLNGQNVPGQSDNRAVASHIKSQHNGAGKNGNSVSGMAKPSMSKSPGAPASVLKKPRRSISKPAASMD